MVPKPLTPSPLVPAPKTYTVVCTCEFKKKNRPVCQCESKVCAQMIPENTCVHMWSQNVCVDDPKGQKECLCAHVIPECVRRWSPDRAVWLWLETLLFSQKITFAPINFCCNAVSTFYMIEKVHVQHTIRSCICNANLDPSSYWKTLGCCSTCRCGWTKSPTALVT